VPPETTNGPLLTLGIPFAYDGAGAKGGTFRVFMSNSEGTSDGGGLGGR
jgi:hypothetical protein